MMLLVERRQSAMVRKKRVAFAVVIALLLCAIPAVSRAQQPETNLINYPAVPVPGSGHDYIQLLNETVNPADGTVSVSIPIMTPPSRKMHLPLAITYSSSNSTHVYTNYEVGYTPGEQVILQGNMAWTPNDPNGGWRNTVPYMDLSEGAQDIGNSSGQPDYCYYYSGFNFHDLQGATHASEVGLAGTYSSVTNTACSPYYVKYDRPDGYLISLPDMPGPDASDANTPLYLQASVSDPNGTVYVFNGSDAYQEPYSASSWVYYPTYIEDRNGNKATISCGSGGCNAWNTSMTDDMGRKLYAINGNSTITVSGYSQPYTLTWSTVPATPVSVTLDYRGYGSEPCSGVSNGSISSQLPSLGGYEISTLQLPNGEQYHFLYDSHGYLSRIVYPNGGYVAYQYNVIPDSTGQQYNGGYADQPDPCPYHAGAYELTSRTVSFDGTNIALVQAFSYTTQWPGGSFDTQWTSKTTTVTTTVADGTSYTTVYHYVPGEPLVPTLGMDLSGSTLYPFVPLESEVDTTWSTGTLSRVEGWYPGTNNEQRCEISTLDGTATSGSFKTWAAPGIPLDVKEFQNGLLNPSLCAQGQSSTIPTLPAATRETAYSYQPFNPNPVIYQPPPPPGLPATTVVGLIDAPCKISVYGQGSLEAETDNYYDGGTALCGITGSSSTSGVPGLPAGSHDETNYGSNGTASRGNVTRVESMNDATTYTYDETGQIVSSIDPCGNGSCGDMNGSNHTTTYSYGDSPSGGDPYGNSNAYLTSVTDPLGHHRSYTYNYKSDELASSTDENGNTTNYTYELSFNRIAEVDGPVDPNNSGQREKVTYAYQDGANPSITVSQLLNTNGAWKTTITTMDGMRHPIQTQISDPEGADIVDTHYDGEGHVYQRSNPYRGGTPVYTTFAYDPLGRMIQQNNPDGTNQYWTYNGATTTFKDERGVQWQRISDGLGRLMQVVEPSGGTTATYAYDALNNLLSVSQTGSTGTQTRSFTYDSLSHLLTAMNPESGTTTYTYDANGNVYTKVDARGVTTTYGYDPLNRVLWKSFSDGTPTTNYLYDVADSGWTNNSQGNNLIGRLTGIFNTVGVIYGYDAMGRMTLASACTPSVCGSGHYDFLAQYDLAGDMTSLTYPDGRVVTDAYDGAQHLTGVQYANWNGQSVGYNYLASATYQPDGHPASITYGNGAVESFSENSRLQPNTALLQMNADNVSQSVYSKQYGYTSSCQSADNGNIANIVDPLNGNRSQGFCYDNLNRISAFSNGDGSMQVAYSIDPFGNMTQSGTETLQVGYNSANNRITSSGFTYDAAGNMTQSDFGIAATFAYDAMGQITNYDNGGATYTYDGGGNRVRKDASGAWTEYVYFGGQPMAEKNSDGSWSDYIFANGQRIAEADSYDERIHTHGTSSGTGEYASWHLPFDGYVVKSGDKISWRQYQAGGGDGGVLLGFTDSTTANWATYDQNGQAINSATTQGQWMERTVDLSAFAGKTIGTLGVVTDAQTGACTWDIYYSDMAIVSTDGTVTPIYDRESAVSLQYYSSAGITNASAAAERSNTANDAEQPANSTTYYVGDQIGSTRMLLAAGGWPLSMDTYYPYGTEATPSSGPNHYKFTGKERDYASGLDYFGARYYSSNMGRFMSPDWSAKATPVPYAELSDPQSLNLYSYVRNNPLSRFDKDGHCDAPSNLKAGQVGICVASYISAKTFDVVGDGDNRGTNGNGGTSRIQTTFTIDPTTGKTDKDKDTVAKSTLMGGHLAAQGTGSSQLSPTATPDSNGNLHLSVDQAARSAYDKGGVLGDISNHVKLEVTPSGQVGIEAGSTARQFPALEIYRYTTDGTTVTTTLVHNYQETSPSALRQPEQPLAPQVPQ